MPAERARHLTWRQERAKALNNPFYSDPSSRELSPETIRDMIAMRRTKEEEAALGGRSHLLDPEAYSPVLKAMLASYEKEPSSQSRPLALRERDAPLRDKFKKITAKNRTYIDLTGEDEDETPASGAAVKDECLAYCQFCKPNQHLDEPFNSSLAMCPKCSEIHRTRGRPCTCPRPDPDTILYETNPDLALALCETNPPLSNLATRVLLLVAQVPPGRYTTYIALGDHYKERWGLMSRKNLASGLKKKNAQWWDVVPVHRVIAKNAGIGGSLEWGDHGQSVDERIELLEGEGMRFDSRGKLLGSTFTEFR